MILTKVKYAIAFLQNYKLWNKSNNRLLITYYIIFDATKCLYCHITDIFYNIHIFVQAQRHGDNTSEI